ncbi:acyltransferase family protein [Azotobacter chroococcum]|uniref:acyltransferase family protein n=1 Tax=Azotobacter chroococcum TaxID=353 RepID=UPI000B5F9F03|nr:acyltransferase [Azotobacter chroococcum]ASL29066.1 acyltransferase [Azotobacter chroococcum]
MKRLELLDYGRFSAALIVMLYHYTFNGIANGKIISITHIPFIIELTKYGYLGVELFFMISGYVIFHSAKNRSAAQFAVSRAIRLYPSYWFAVLFTSLFAWYWGGSAMSVHPLQILANMTLLQSYFGFDHVDGVYWTLVYEVMFYAAVFIILLCGMQRSLDSIFIYWPILMCLAILLDLQHLPYLGGYFYYFAAGSLFALLKKAPGWRTIFSLAITFALCVSFSSEKATWLSESKGVLHSSYTIAFIITMFFIFFLILNLKKVQTLQLPKSKIFGALTYPAYLIHAHFGYMLINKFATEENKLFIYTITICMVLLVALAMHKLIEVNLSTLWKNLFTSTLGRAVSKVQAVFDRLHPADIKHSIK